MNHNSFAVVVIFGVNLPFSGPVVSALISWKPPTPKIGSSATVSITIPMPPIQCIWHLHKFILRGKTSMSFTIVAPVVEKPLALSKNASVRLGMAPLAYSGMTPKAVAVSHATATTTKELRMLNCTFCFRPIKKKKTNTSQLTSMGIAKQGITSCSP